jgi:hypothetical protein
MHEVFVKKRIEPACLKQGDVVLIRESTGTGSLNMQNTFFHYVTTLLQYEIKFETNIKRHTKLQFCMFYSLQF